MRIPVIFLSMVLSCHGAVGVRLILGLSDTASTKWDGSVTVSRARIAALEPWRFEGADEILSGNAWKASTHPIRLFGGGRQGAPPVVGNGVLVWLEGESEATELAVKTAQGNFSMRLADVPYGVGKKLLDGKVLADRIPASTQVTRSPDEQDMPAAAAAKNGDVWIAYLDFKHNPEHVRLRLPFQIEEKKLDEFTKPTGGDRIMARRYAGGKWDEAIAMSEGGGDVYRPAIAVDGSGRPWVFWSANDARNNFDLFARPIENGKPGRVLRVSAEAGADMDPAAATDSTGKVWVAWQAWRAGKAQIHCATQNGSGFQKPEAVAVSAGNEWNAAIATSSDGRVSIAWDSYRNGNYDVFLRTAVNGKWGAEQAGANTAKYEAYPTLAYDKSNRLWLAYEEGAVRWGKDWGAYDTAGAALYQGRAIRLVGFEASGARVEPAAAMGDFLPGPPERRVDYKEPQGSGDAWTASNPEAVKERRPSATPPVRPAPKNTMPRLCADASGRLWLAFRSSHPIRWSTIGSVWSEYVVSYDGERWTGPIFIAHSANLLDNRPALASARAGELLVVGSSDGRSQFHQALPRVAMEKGDPYQNDIFANVVNLPTGSGTLRAKAVPAPTSAGADAMREVERKAIAAMRTLRVKNLKLVRGEFHRHSEISMDGGSDGSLIDQFRYLIDTAAMDWAGCCDHDNGSGREYTWWLTQKLTTLYFTPGVFVPMYSYERSVSYPEGHRNVVFAQRGVRTLPRLPISEGDKPGHAPDTQLLYKYLKLYNGVVASHTSGTSMGTDWRDNDPETEPVVEIYQGDRQNYEMPGAPRTNTAEDSIGGWKPKGFVNLALEMGYKLGFQASSDHVSTHMSYCNIFVKDGSREAILEGLKKRHVYGATDNILADVTSGEYMMGDVFTTAKPPELRVKLTGTAPFAKVHIIKNNKYAYSVEPNKPVVDFTWRDNAAEKGKSSYYYVRGDQANGEIVWVSPMWITYR